MREERSVHYWIDLFSDPILSLPHKQNLSLSPSHLSLPLSIFR